MQTTLLFLGMMTFALPAALALCFGFLTIRKDDITVVDFLGYAARFFLTSQQYYEWREP